MPAEVWLICLTTLVNRLGTMVLPFLVLYLTQDVGVSPSLAGFALTVFGFGGLLSSLAAGRLSDRLGSVRVLQGSLLLSGMLLPLLPLARSVPAVFALILVWAVIGEAIRPCTLASITAAAPAQQRKVAVALYRLAINLGMSVGPVVGGFLAMSSFRLLFILDGGTSVASALLLIAFMGWRRETRRKEPTPQESVSDTVGPFRDRRMLIFFAGFFLMSCVYFQLEGPLALFVVRDLGLPKSFYGTLFLINTGLIIFLEVSITMAASAWPHRRALVTGALLLSAGFGALAFAKGAWSIVPAAVIWTFGEMVFNPVAATYPSELAPAGRRGQYAGAYYTVFSFAFMLGPWLGTVFMEHFGAKALWAATFVCGVTASIIFGVGTKTATERAQVTEQTALR